MTVVARPASPCPTARGRADSPKRRPAARPATAALILLSAALAGCSSDEAPTAPPVDGTDPPAFAPATDPGALAVALEDARTRLIPALDGAAASSLLEPAVRGLEAALADRDAVAFAWRLAEAEAALAAAGDADAGILVEFVAVELALGASRAALGVPTHPGDTP